MFNVAEHFVGELLVVLMKPHGQEYVGNMNALHGLWDRIAQMMSCGKNVYVPSMILLLAVASYDSLPLGLLQ